MDELLKQMTLMALHAAKLSITLVNVFSQPLSPAAQKEGRSALAFRLSHLFGSRGAIGHEVKAALSPSGNEVEATQVPPQIDGKHSVHCLAEVIKGLLRNGQLHAGLHQILAMHAQDDPVRMPLLVLLLETACNADRAEEVVCETHSGGIAYLLPEAISLFLADCLHSGSVASASAIFHAARKSSLALLPSAYQALLKLYAADRDARASLLFADMQASDSCISETLCIALLSRCAQSNFALLAEDIAAYARANAMMTLSLYNGLMRVYANCSMYSEACDLYTEMRGRGMEPSEMMLGRLIRFSKECGRTELLTVLQEKASHKVQYYMPLIKKAASDHNVEAAMEVLQMIKSHGNQADIAAYNSVLDVCVRSRDMARAQKLFHDMRRTISVNVITYNTLLKGFCLNGNLKGAQQLFTEMRHAGIAPDDITYNCLIDVAGRSGNLKEAWAVIHEMERDGIPVNQYTIAIMLKWLRHSRREGDVRRALAFLDRSQANVCTDEVLLNTVLDICIRCRESTRLKRIITEMESPSAGKPSLNTYSCLIRACGAVRCHGSCWKFWDQMVLDRSMEPTDVLLGCMLDALVSCDQVGEAVDLFNSWKGRIPANLVMYSTLIKGFMNSGEADRCMELWREMQAEGVKMNTVVYNSLINAQAHIGATSIMSQLVSEMESDGCLKDSITYSILIKGYCVAGDLDTALEFLCTSHTLPKMDISAFNFLLKKAFMYRRMELVDQIMSFMEKSSAVPNSFTLSIIIRISGECGYLDKALQALRLYGQRHHASPTSQVFSSLVAACRDGNDFRRVWTALLELCAKGMVPDSKVWGGLITGLVRSGDVKDAVGLVKEAYGLGGPRLLRPGDEIAPKVLQELFRHLRRHGQQHQETILLRQLGTAGISLGEISAALS